MSSSILDKAIVLALNNAWQPIGHRTVRKAIVALTGGDQDTPPAVGLDIAYPKVGDAWNFDTPLYLNPVKWADWLDLPIRDFDFTISTAKQLVRVPTVIIATNFAKMPMTSPRFSRRSVFERDGGRCQYSGEYVGWEGGNLDHVVSRHRKGANSFENVVWAKKSINSAKAEKSPEEVGLRLIRPPKAPNRVPISTQLKEVKHPDWQHFIHAG